MGDRPLQRGGSGRHARAGAQGSARSREHGFFPVSGAKGARDMVPVTLPTALGPLTGGGRGERERTQ